MAIGRSPAATSRSRTCICCVENSSIPERSLRRIYNSGGGRIGVDVCRGAFQLRQNIPQRGNQLIARNVALLELNAELESIVLRFKIENERLRTLRSSLLFTAFAARFVAGQATLKDARKHFQHFLFGGLPG